MIITAIVVVALVGGWIHHRRTRKSTLAGLDSAKPVFSVDPPIRRLGSRKGERL